MSRMAGLKAGVTLNSFHDLAQNSPCTHSQILNRVQDDGSTSMSREAF